MREIQREEAQVTESDVLTPLTFTQVEGCADIDTKLAAILKALEECSRQQHLISPEYLRRDRIRNGCHRDGYGRAVRMVEGNASRYHMHAWEYESETPELVVTKGIYADYCFNSESPEKVQVAGTYWLLPPLLLNGQELQSARDKSAREICAKYTKGKLEYAYILEYGSAPDGESRLESGRVLRKHISARFKNGQAVEASILDCPAGDNHASELIIMRNRRDELSQEVKHPLVLA